MERLRAMDQSLFHNASGIFWHFSLGWQVTKMSAGKHLRNTDFFDKEKYIIICNFFFYHFPFCEKIFRIFLYSIINSRKNTKLSDPLGHFATGIAWAIPLVFFNSAMSKLVLGTLICHKWSLNTKWVDCWPPKTLGALKVELVAR